MTKLTKHDEISLALHAAIKRELLANPQQVIQIAKSNLVRWKDSYGDDESTWMIEWAAILGRGEVDEILAMLTGDDEKSVFLRSSTPFTGVISSQERDTIRAQFLKGSITRYENPASPFGHLNMTSNGHKETCHD
ncbi:MAG: hypothetical protein OQK94_00990 [Gammaproteobacteria bacterium]|nr:hypothetical protein [Gammaproteobacteria bacterium]MCW8839871.1 hypothetical protein [Gammaproteobacteria bacterium]MCW8958912.1 hypothetical protein [Gammaproteobacteria bacterium]MCW8992414.1 hypothetical protein [Gammaproteobacteria bacterium]